MKDFASQYRTMPKILEQSLGLRILETASDKPQIEPVVAVSFDTYALVEFSTR